MIKFLIIGVLALSCSKLQIDQEKVSTSPILNKAISEIALRYDDEFSQCPKIKGYCTRDIVKLYHLGKKEDAFAKAKKLCRKEQDPNCRALGVLYSADLQMNKSRDTLAKGCVKGDSQSCSSQLLLSIFIFLSRSFS